MRMFRKVTWNTWAARCLPLLVTLWILSGCTALRALPGIPNPKPLPPPPEVQTQQQPPPLYLWKLPSPPEPPTENTAAAVARYLMELDRYARTAHASSQENYSRVEAWLRNHHEGGAKIKSLPLDRD